MRWSSLRPGEYPSGRAALQTELGGDQSGGEAPPGETAVGEQRVDRLQRLRAERAGAQLFDGHEQLLAARRRVELVGEPYDRVLVDADLALRAAFDRADDERAPQRLVQPFLRNRHRLPRRPRNRDAALDLPEFLEEAEPLAVRVRGCRGPGTPS